MKTRHSKPVIILTIVLIVAVAYFAISTTSARMSQPEKTKLIIGTSTPFPPFEYRAGNDEIVGIDIELAKKIAEESDKELVIKDFSDLGALLPALNAGEIDMIAAAMTINDDRKEVADFSKPYYQTSQCVLALRESTFSCQGYCNPGDFAGLVVGYQSGTTNQFWFENNLYNKAEIKGNQSFSDLQMGIQLLKLKSIDVIVLDKPAAESFVKRNPSLKVAGLIQGNEEYGFAVQRGDPQKILPVIDNVLGKMKETGEYNQLLNKWFGG